MPDGQDDISKAKEAMDAATRALPEAELKNLRDAASKSLATVVHDFEEEKKKIQASLIAEKEALRASIEKELRGKLLTVGGGVLVVLLGAFIFLADQARDRLVQSEREVRESTLRVNDYVMSLQKDIIAAQTVVKDSTKDLQSAEDRAAKRYPLSRPRSRNMNGGWLNSDRVVISNFERRNTPRLGCVRLTLAIVND